ncbi:MarR family winged helix-turn-helix transcriptional regulator [Vallitalea okinawensis]|uniref:MarR family winged helix-turn-helix transcriptional regulator n=1 Tax=Vallitalea okinawensis TaxID=2078660 RepID=UPI001FA88D1F|nr:MarR family transcriptional regulator [Vallitalea okinawensis]
MISKYNVVMKTDNSIYLIGRIRERANNFITSELEQLGLTGIVPSHGDILATLYQYGELTMTEIADKIHRDRSTVTTLINKLTKLGFVATKKNPKDSRSNLVYLTQKGRDIEPQFREIGEKIFEKEYVGISEEERELFLNILNKIFKNL